MITDQDYDYYELQKLTRSHFCSICGSILTLAYGEFKPGYFGYFVRCGTDKTHPGITRHDPDYEKKKKRYFGMESTALGKLNETQMIARVGMARFPKDLTIDQKRIIARIALEYGLDPLMGELMIYQGNPYIRIDGRRRKAQETNQLDGISSRPANKEEREARQVQDGDYLYKAEVRRKGSAYTFDGWGKVTKAEIERAIAGAERHDKDEWFIPIVKDPGDIAEKRAESEALKRAFNLPLPSFEDVFGAPPAPEPEPRVVATLNPDNPLVRKAAEQIAAPGPLAPTTQAPTTRPARDPETIKTYFDLQKFCNIDFGLQPKDVLAELNVTSVNDLTAQKRAPAECYKTILAVRKG